MITILCNEINTAIDWLQNNSIQFKAIVFSKSKDPILTNFHIKEKIIESKKSVHLLGITFDYKLDFSVHINYICGKASGNLNALFRLKHYLCDESINVAVNSFILPNFNYCPLIFDSELRLEKLYQRSLKLLNNKNYISGPPVFLYLIQSYTMGNL